MACGYAVTFQEDAVTVPASKQPLLRKSAATHSMVFLQCNAGLAVEIVEYPEPGEETNSATVELASPPDMRSLIAGGAERAWKMSGGERNLVCWNASDYQACVSFWSKIFSRDPTLVGEGVAATFQIRAPLPRWNLTLQIGSRAADSDCMLDDPGITCLSLLCKDVVQMEKNYMKAGATYTTGILPFRLGGKNVDLALVRCPGGQIIELTQLSL